LPTRSPMARVRREVIRSPSQEGRKAAGVSTRDTFTIPKKGAGVELRATAPTVDPVNSRLERDNLDENLDAVRCKGDGR
jgi:hypothetical protein